MTPNDVSYAHCVTIKFLGPTDYRPSRYKVTFRNSQFERVSKTISKDAITNLADVGLFGEYHERQGVAHWGANVFLEYLNSLDCNHRDPMILLKVVTASIDADTEAVFINAGYQNP